MEKNLCQKKYPVSVFSSSFIRTFEKNLEDTITRCEKH